MRLSARTFFNGCFNLYCVAAPAFYVVFSFIVIEAKNTRWIKGLLLRKGINPNLWYNTKAAIWGFLFEAINVACVNKPSAAFVLYIPFLPGPQDAPLLSWLSGAVLSCDHGGR